MQGNRAITGPSGMRYLLSRRNRTAARRSEAGTSALRLGASGHPGAETRECQGAGRMVDAMEVKTSAWLGAGGEK